MGKAKTILLVDDDKELAQANREIIRAEGYDVQVAYDGASGVALAKKIKPDLMILDVMMATDTEGFDVSRDIAVIPELKNMPVIILTGIRQTMGLSGAFGPDEAWLPVKAVLEKPVPPEKLLAAIRKHVG